MMNYNYKPPLKELQTSLKLRSREFFLENSLHGIRYIVDPKRPMWERLIWLILTLSSFGGTIGIIVIILRKFQLEPTITGLETGTLHLKIQFPIVFICYDWNQLNTTQLPESEKHVYKELYDWSWRTSTLEGLSDYKDKDNFREVFKKMSPDCDVVLHQCVFNEVGSCSAMFKKVLIPSGACCKYKHPKPTTTADAPWELKFEAQIYPLRIFLVSPSGGTPTRFERPMVELDRAVLMTYDVHLTFSEPSLKYLMRQQRSCHFPSEQPLVQGCLTDCSNRQIMHRCNCLPWFLNLLGEKPECPLEKYSCVKEAYQNMRVCDCTLPCNCNSIVPYKIKFPRTSNETVSSIRMTTWPWTTYKRETRFGYLDLLVSFGGIGGLFLGYSVLTTVELGYYFSLRTYCGAVIDTSRKKHNITTVHVVQAKRLASPDVKPIYFPYAD